MKQIFLSMLMLVTFSYGTCTKEAMTPECIRQKINTIKAQPKWNPPAQVDEYVYNGKRVFLFSSDCCDQYNQVVDEHCNIICAPSGGITGHGDGRCADFTQNATFIRNVWKDDR